MKVLCLEISQKHVKNYHKVTRLNTTFSLTLVIYLWNSCYNEVWNTELTIAPDLAITHWQ